MGEETKTVQIDLINTYSYCNGWMDNWIYFLVIDGVAIDLVYHNQTFLIGAHRFQKRDCRSSSVNPIC